MIRHSLLNQADWDKTAFITNDGGFTYRNIAQKALAIARRLLGAGSQNIAIYLQNGERYVEALYGVLMAGLTAFPLNTRLTKHEIVPLLTLARVSVIVTSSEHRALWDDVAMSMDIIVIYVDMMPEHGNNAFCASIDIDEHAPMILLATSGTTGNAKIVQLSERNVAASTYAYISKMDFESKPVGQMRFALGTPYSSAYGLMVLTACIIKSIPLVELAACFSLAALYTAAEKHRVTHFEGGVSVGLLMEQMAGRPIRSDISSLRYFGLAGSKISACTLRRLYEAYPGVEFWPGYGMTEAGPLIAKPDKRVNMEKLGSVGTKIGCLTIMISANGQLSEAPDVTGEIAVKGPNVMMGYYGNKEATDGVLKEGFLYTGDIGYLDQDGYLYIVGRIKNAINVRGFIVYAEEVEEAIISSGLAKDCFVYGETEQTGNEIVCADVLPISNGIRTERFHAYCQTHLADYKRPKRIRQVELIKKTATGKTERA